jgi:hypothetical protein
MYNKTSQFTASEFTIFGMSDKRSVQHNNIEPEENKKTARLKDFFNSDIFSDGKSATSSPKDIFSSSNNNSSNTGFTVFDDL